MVLSWLGSCIGSKSVVTSTYFAREVGLEPLDQRGEREPEPRNHHRPGLDAAHPMDSFFEPEPADQRVYVEGALLDLAFYFEHPGSRPQQVATGLGDDMGGAPSA